MAVRSSVRMAVNADMTDDLSGLVHPVNIPTTGMEEAYRCVSDSERSEGCATEIPSRPLHPRVSTGQNTSRTIITTAMPIIIRFSVSDTKPRGTFEPPPTQAHFSSRLSR